MLYGDAQKISQAIGTGIQHAQTVEPPRTIASAAGRLDSLNERLTEVATALESVAGQLGALSALNGGDAKARPPSAGAVDRLNNSVDDAHGKLSEIEALIVGIGRALG